MKENIIPNAEVDKASMIWKKVLIGTKDNFVDLINRENFNVTDNAAKLIKNSSFNSKLNEEEKEIDLVALSIEDLGFNSSASLKDIYSAAEFRGLSLCPSEAGPQLYRQCRNEIKENSVIIAMKPILDKIFSVISDNKNKKCLSTCQGQSHMNFSKNSVFVFQKKS